MMITCTKCSSWFKHDGVDLFLRVQPSLSVQPAQLLSVSPRHCYGVPHVLIELFVCQCWVLLQLGNELTPIRNHLHQ